MTQTKSNTTTVSVVVPSFNQAQYIGRTLDSILSQDCPVEVIVIDGGSSDGSKEVIESYADRLAYWVSEKDNGQTHAINKGMARATGTLRAYLNSDDLYLPGAIAEVVRAYEANPEADIFHGRCVTIDDEGRRLDRAFYSDIETNEDILDLWQVWFKGRNFVQPEVFWTKRIADRVGPFDEARHYAMDYDYWARCIIAGAQVHHIDRDISAFRIWAQQKSTASQKAADELRAIAIAHLNDPDVQLDATLRRQLRGDWAFDEIYSKSAGELASSDLGPFRRRAALAGILMKNTSLLFSRSFRAHVGKLVSNRVS